MVEALVNPSILAWARERAGFAVSDIAEKLKIKQDQVIAWESGEKKPTFKQAQRLVSGLSPGAGFTTTDLGRRYDTG